MLFLWMWEVNCLLIWISKHRNMDLDFYWSMIETKELYFKNSPLETCEITSKHVLYCYISPYDIPGLKASKLCCQCMDLLCQSYGNTCFTNPKLWLCQSQIPFTACKHRLSGQRSPTAQKDIRNGTLNYSETYVISAGLFHEMGLLMSHRAY